MLNAQERRELEQLRARAYGRGGDLAGDPEAARRLQQLEDRARETPAPSDEDSVRDPVTPATSTPMSTPTSRWRWRFAAVLAGAVAVTAVVSAVIATIIATPEPGDPARFQTIVQGEGWLTDSSRAVTICLERNGWEVAFDEETGTFAFAGERQGHAEAVNECAALTRAEYQDRIRELRGLRRYPVEVRIANCLRDEGIDIPEPPTRAEFAARYDTAGAWQAYSYVTSLSPEEWGRISEVCPPDMD